MRLLEVLREATEDAKSVEMVKWWTSLASGNTSKVWTGETGNARSVTQIFRANNELSEFIKEYYSTVLVKLDLEMGTAPDLKSAVTAVRDREHKDDTSLKEALRAFPTYLLPFNQIKNDIAKFLGPLDTIGYEHDDGPRGLTWIDIHKTSAVVLPSNWKKTDGIGGETSVAIIGKEDPIVFSIGYYTNPHVHTQQVIIFRVDHVDKNKVRSAADELVEVFKSLGISEDGEDVGIGRAYI